MTDLTWMTHPERPCANQDPEAYFPTERIARKEAATLCAGCPVIAQCLDYALQAGVHGVWGGTTEQQRAEMGGRRPRNHDGLTKQDRAKPRSRDELAPCGTESAYQRHRARHDLDCPPCREAHAKHQRAKARERRLAAIEEGAA